MSRRPIPFRRRKSTTDRAIEVAQNALKVWAASRAAKLVSKRKAPSLLGAGAALAAGVVALKQVRRKPDVPAYSPPASPTPPQPDRIERTPPHGDKAASLTTPGPTDAPPPGGGATTAGTASSPPPATDASESSAPPPPASGPPPSTPAI